MVDDTFEVGGVTYRWDDRNGLIANNMKVATAQVPLLLARLEPRLVAQDEAITNPLALAARAAIARKSGHRGRAERMARRALLVDAECLPAVAALSAVLRELDRSDEAVLLTDPHHWCSAPALLTTRAAALLDVGRAADSLNLAKRAWAISLNTPDGPAAELRNFYHRLRSEGLVG